MRWLQGQERQFRGHCYLQQRQRRFLLVDDLDLEYCTLIPLPL